jgi:3'-phosphoadenosine 5'-phosphosulfate sulfotransferase (PAPS reductase)/FAD synthetase
MGTLKSYTPDSPPRSGTAKKIWDYAAAHGVQIAELHYNQNIWGAGQDRGWGTWACTFVPDTLHVGYSRALRHGCWLRWIPEMQQAWGEQMEAPYEAFNLANAARDRQEG